MPRRLVRALHHVLAVALLALALLPAGAPARAARDDGDLWATVNACDTAARPDAVGIRASMPGGRAGLALRMRFQVEYRDERDGRWRSVRQGADSGWQPVGSSDGSTVEYGYDFRFRPPAGGSHTVRGVVSFEWRRQARAVRRARRVTTAGHPRPQGSDPPNYSAAVCVIR